MVSMNSTTCPPNSFLFNLTQCACNPGYVLNHSAAACALFRVSPEDFAADSGVGAFRSPLTFPGTNIFAFDNIKRFTQSQAVFLEATLVVVLSWLLFCFLLRLTSLGDGRGLWFQIRWWISRLDVCFAASHWLDDQQPVKKRKTELGGTLSIASLILFTGLFTALLYRIISKRTIEVHNVRAASALDFTTFANDMEFNITAISSMSCSHLRGLGTLVSGNPGFNDKLTSLSTFGNYSCHNTTNGPTISLKCHSCPLLQDSVFISWHFVDLPNDPAIAVGFQFNLTAKNHANPKYLSFVSGVLKNRSKHDDTEISFRGADVNILKFTLFPRVYNNLHDLKLVQPLFYEFLPGSSFSEINQLYASLQSAKDGLVNITLYINPLSAYIVEVDNETILGPVSFLADLGGLYCFSICFFFYFLVQCEFRMKKLRTEDSIMHGIRNRRKALARWDKLRKYVRYTWGSSAVDNVSNNIKQESCCPKVSAGIFNRNGASLKQRQPETTISFSFNKKRCSPSKKSSSSDCTDTHMFESSAETVADLKGRFPHGSNKHDLTNEEGGQMKNYKAKCFVGSHEEDVSEPQRFPAVDNYILPPPPSLEYKAGSEIDLSDMKRNLDHLREYNVMLREKLMATHSVLEALIMNASPKATRSQA